MKIIFIYIYEIKVCVNYNLYFGVLYIYVILYKEISYC